MPQQSERMSDEAVRAKTGKTWDEWLAILDAAGARSMGNKEIGAPVDRLFAAWSDAALDRLQAMVEG